MSDSRTVSPVLIVSTGRTGTRFLAEHLQVNYPQAEAHHITERSTLLNVLSNVQLSGLMSENQLLGLWKLLKGSRFARTQKSVFVDSNNHLFAFARLASRIYPNVRIVHVVRDPRSYVRSHLNWATQRFKSRIANTFVPFWQPNGWLIGEVSAIDWIAMSKFEKFCWVWHYKNRLLAGMQVSATPYLQVRFEDFTSANDHQHHLNRILEFIGLEPTGLNTATTKPINETKSGGFPQWPLWTAAQCQHLERWCGEQMREYGYGAEPEWLERLATPAANT